MANIHTRRRSGFVTRGGRNVRETVWAALTTVSQATMAAASTAVAFGGFTAAVLALRPFTIIRTRGVWRIESDQSAASERQQCALGMAVVTDQALAIGVTAIPTPATDGSSDAFFLHDVILNDLLVGDATGFGQIGKSSVFDSRAMRKVEEGFDLGASTETFSTSSGVTADTWFRILLKLH